MKFILVFITAAMSHGPANVGDVPHSAAFDTLAECEVARKALVKPSELGDHTRGWQCISQLVNGSNPPAQGATACVKWSHEFYEASKLDTTFDACFALYPREMSAQISRDGNGNGDARGGH
jgi:hypothetical protein